MEKIRQGTYTLERIREIERVNDHDMGAFVRAFEESLGPEGRFVHMGLTSSDVVDTGLALQLRDACDLLLQKARALTAVLERQALAYKDTPQMGRSHGVHAEPITFGFKLLLWVEEMRRNVQRLERAREEIAVGKISGAVGTHANVPPGGGGARLRHPGAGRRPRLQPDRAARPPRPAAVHPGRDRRPPWTSSPPRSAICSGRRCWRRRSPSRAGARAPPRCPTSATRPAASASPAWPASCAAFATVGLENVALWHERDISHSSAERVVLPGRLHRPGLHRCTSSPG